MSQRVQYTLLAFAFVFVGTILLAMLIQLLSQVVGLPVTAGALMVAAAAGLVFYTWDLLTERPGAPAPQVPIESGDDTNDVP